MTDPWVGEANDSLVVSIKPTTKFDSALIVFKAKDGPGIQQAIASFFRMDPVSVTSQTPYETFLEAERHAKGVNVAVRGLGATVVPGSLQPREPARPAPEPAQVPSGEGLDLTPEQALILKIMAVQDMTALTDLWEQNKPLYKDHAVKAATTARSKELQA